MVNSSNKNSQALPESSANKEILRMQFREKRTLLSPAQIALYSRHICEKIVSILPHSSTSIHLFLPIRRLKEVDLTPLLPTLWERGDKVYVPRVTNNVLEHVEIFPDTIIQENDWGIPEPLEKYPGLIPSEISNLHFVLTPLLVCDTQGARVGYGGGFYDQFFHEYPHLYRIGVGFFEPVCEILDAYSGDMPLHQYISPQKITHFTVEK